MKSVSIIGSFRKEKHYSKVIEVISSLSESGVVVLSPAGTDIVNSINDFVIFSSDDSSLTPEEIEKYTLDKILASDIVYVCDVDGYIGRTTAYEIGVCIALDKEIYFMEYPLDFPMGYHIPNVMSIPDLVNYASDKNFVRILDNN